MKMLPSVVNLTWKGAPVQAYTERLVELSRGDLGGPLWQILSRNNTLKSMTNSMGMRRLFNKSAESIGKRCAEMIIELVASNSPIGKHVEFGFSEMFAIAPAAWAVIFYAAVMQGLGEKRMIPNVLLYIEAIDNARMKNGTTP